jgi:hypothetical protein
LRILERAVRGRIVGMQQLKRCPRTKHTLHALYSPPSLVFLPYLGPKHDYIYVRAYADSLICI